MKDIRHLIAFSPNDLNKLKTVYEDMIYGNQSGIKICKNAVLTKRLIRLTNKYQGQRPYRPFGLGMPMTGKKDLM